MEMQFLVSNRPECSMAPKTGNMVRALACAVSFAGAAVCAANPTQIVQVADDGNGRVFEGIGGLSAGASSRLLMDYPEPARSTVLDILFKPKYALSFQYLKVEVGGDANSTDGSEASHARSRDELLHPRPEYYKRGYEWWLMEEAKKRNPHIQLGALAWSAPGWIGDGSYFSRDMADYYVAFIKGAKKHHGVQVDFVGTWNEKRYGAATMEWIKMFRGVLDANGLKQVGIVAADQNGRKYQIAVDARNDPKLMDSITVFGDHYPEWGKKRPYFSSDAAIASGKRIWNAEAGPWHARWQDVPYIAKLNNRCYIEGRMTRITSWSLISSYYDILSLPSSGPMRANAPWCGAFEIQPAVWATAHTTQFTEPGWKYVDSGCGYLKNRAGSYVTLKSQDGSGDFSIIVETMDAEAPGSVAFQLPPGFAQRPVHVWRTLVDAKEAFVRQADITPQNRLVSLELQPHAIYSLTTTSGQQKAEPASPPLKPFPLPYRDDFEAACVGGLPKYFSDIQGAFEIVERPDGKGKCLEQKIVKAPIYWGRTSNGKANNSTIIGDPGMCDYRVKTDVFMEEAGVARIYCRLGKRSMNRGKSDPAGYFLEVDAGGNWRLGGGTTVFASGRVAFAQKTWHAIAIGICGTNLSGTIDGKQVASADVSKPKNPKDKVFERGLAGLGTEFNRVLFDDFEIVPLGASPHRAPTGEESTVRPIAELLKSVRSNVPETVDPPQNAVDGDPTTFWHSPWKKQVPLPHDLIIELEKPVTFKGITYLARQDSKSGRVARYEIFVARDAKHWGRPVAKGSLDAGESMQSILFDKPVTASHIKFRALSECSGKSYASVAELGLVMDGKKNLKN
jgi:galactosylceramidase